MLKIPGLKIHKEKVEKRIGGKFGSWNVDSSSGREMEVCEELRKRQVDVCCLQEVRWRGEGTRFFGNKGRRYTILWCGNDDKTGSVGTLVKELCEKVVEVKRRCDRVMVIGSRPSVSRRGAYAPQSGKPHAEERFYENMTREWNMAHAIELVLGLEDFNNHGKCVEGFEGIHI